MQKYAVEKRLGVMNIITQNLHCTGAVGCERATLYGGYYTVSRRYEFYVRVARTISHERAKRTSVILFLPREHKIHICELTCNVFSLYRHTSKKIPQCPTLLICASGAPVCVKLEQRKPIIF